MALTANPVLVATCFCVNLCCFRKVLRRCPKFTNCITYFHGKCTKLGFSNGECVCTKREVKVFMIEILIAALCVIAIVLITIGIFLTLKKRRFTKEYDLMDGRDFEFFCAELLEKRGFLEVEVTKGSGDNGVDILAEKDGVTYAIQCKRYEEPIGVKAVQEAYAGRDYYDRMVGVVMANQYFTKNAVDMAKKLKIMLWDRGYLEEMIEEE